MNPLLVVVRFHIRNHTLRTGTTLLRFSNSMVEARNKIIKYHYLFKHDFRDINELRKLLDWIIPDYQYERPHHSLKV